jgi:hypothetical protein
METQKIRKIKIILGICLLAAIIIYMVSTDTESISVAVNDDYLILSYSSGDSFEIKLIDITSVKEKRNLDLGKFVSGIETKKYSFGVWKNDEFGEYNLCIYSNVEKYIVVETTTNIFVFNIESDDATDSFYQAFTDLLKTK